MPEPALQGAEAKLLYVGLDRFKLLYVGLDRFKLLYAGLRRDHP